MADGFFGRLGPVLQGAGASLASTGDLTQIGATIPRFQAIQQREQALAGQQQLRDLQTQAAQQRLADAERERQQEQLALKAFQGGTGMFGSLTPEQRAIPVTGPQAVALGGKLAERALVPPRETPLQVAQRRKLEVEAANLKATGGRKPPPGFVFSADRKRLEPIAGGPKDPVRTKEFRDQSRTFGRLSRDLTAYRNALQKNTGKFSLSNRRRLSRLHTNLLLQMKNAEELGVLTGPDVDLLTSQLLDPTAITTDEASLLEGIDALQNRVSADTEQFRQTFGATQKQLGFKPLVAVATTATPGTATATAPAPASGAPATAGKPAPSLQAALPKMREGQFVTNNVTGKRWQKVGGRLVPVDDLTPFASKGAGLQ